MWLTKDISEDFREARFCTERRVLRLLCRGQTMVKTFGHEMMQESEARDFATQFEGVDIKLFHSLPAGKSALSWVHTKLMGRYVTKAIPFKIYMENRDENEPPRNKFDAAITRYDSVERT